VGLLADVAAVLALQRVRVRAARAWSQDSWGVSAWDVTEEVDPAVLRDRFAALVEGRLDVERRLRLDPAADVLPPTVEVHHEASRTSTVLEVRASDRLSVVHHVCATLARLDIAVRSAHVDTLGPQAVDVFYLQEAWAGALADDRAADAAHAVRSALAGAG
jgi:[protein-PII] uridylyltransferase